MIASISFSENNPVASSSSFLALSVTESAPALTAPAAVETPLEMPLTTFLIALFRRPSFLFLGASEEPEEEDPPEDDEELDEEEEGVDALMKKNRRKIHHLMPKN